MKKIIFFITAAFIFSIQNVQAQVTQKIPCPSIVLNGPASYTVEEGDSLVFKVKPLGKVYDDMGVTYNWAISSGFIEKGQGSSVIYVNTGGLKGLSVTATVEVGGLEPACPNIHSYTVEVIEKKPVPKARSQAKPKPRGKTTVKKT